MIGLGGAAVLVDSLMVATAGGVVLLGLVHLILWRRSHWSGALRQRLLDHSLLGCMALFVVSLVAQPGPVGCISDTCARASDQAIESGKVQSYYTAAAAGKFQRSAAGTRCLRPFR